MVFYDFQLIVTTPNVLSIVTFSTNLVPEALKLLNWLPIKQRIMFKILLYAHRFVHQPGQLPIYLSHFEHICNLLVPKFRYNFGRSFSYTVAVE